MSHLRDDSLLGNEARQTADLRMFGALVPSTVGALTPHSVNQCPTPCG